MYRFTSATGVFGIGSVFFPGSELSHLPLFFLASSDDASTTSAIFGSGGIFKDDLEPSSASLLVLVW